MKRITIQISDKAYAFLEEMEKQHEVSKPEIIRTYINEKMERFEQLALDKELLQTKKIS